MTAPTTAPGDLFTRWTGATGGRHREPERIADHELHLWPNLPTRCASCRCPMVDVGDATHPTCPDPRAEIHP
jgi:hypothetical protein